MSYGQDQIRGANVRQRVELQLIRVEAAHAAKKLKAVFGASLDISVHVATNTIIMQASLEKLKQVRKFLSRMDVETYLCAIQLKNINVALAARPLRLLLIALARFGDNCDDVYVVATTRNMIIIYATDERINEARTILHWLDGTSKP
jgi:type II secretory pathway component GspD/PulD (secretin)